MGSSSEFFNRNQVKQHNFFTTFFLWMDHKSQRKIKMQPSAKWRFGRFCFFLKWHLFPGACLSIHLSSGPNHSTMTNSRNGSPAMTSSCSIKHALPFQLKNWSCISDTHTTKILHTSLKTNMDTQNHRFGKGDPFRIWQFWVSTGNFGAVISTCRFKITPNKMRTAKTHSNLSSLSVAQHRILVPTPTVLLLLQVYLHTWVQINDMNQVVNWCFGSGGLQPKGTPTRLVQQGTLPDA